MLIGGYGLQPSLMDRLLDTPPGLYTSAEILQLLSDNDIAISYSHSALLSEKVEITQEQTAVKSLIEKVFDLENYSYATRGEKILIIRCKDKIKRNRSGVIDRHEPKTLVA